MSAIYTCPLCSLSYTTLRLYVSHLRVIHAKDHKFNIMCGVGGCREVFRAFSAFNSHVYRRHRSAMGMSNEVMEAVTVASVEPPSSNEHFADFEDQLILRPNQEPVESCSLLQKKDSSCNSVEHQQALTAAKMILQLREGHQVSQVAIAEIMSNCRLLCNQSVDHLKKSVYDVLNISEPLTQSVQSVLQQEYDPFKGIDTNYLFEKFCVDNLGLVVRAFVYLCNSMNNSSLSLDLGS